MSEAQAEQVRQGKWAKCRNEQGTFDCPDPSCQRRGERAMPTEGALYQHISSYHPTLIDRRRKGKISRMMQAHDNGNGNGHTNGNGHREGSIVRRPRMPKEKAEVIKLDSFIEPVNYVNYCPRCNEPIRLILMSIANSTIPCQCPKCHLNLTIVNLAMSPQMQAIDQAKAGLVMQVAHRVATQEA
jgi:hypothetical protein